MRRKLNRHSHALVYLPSSACSIVLYKAPRSAVKSQSILINASGRVYKSTWNSPTVEMREEKLAFCSE